VHDRLHQGSIADFDSALAADQRLRPYLWQRGLSLYYAQRFEEGAKQARGPALQHEAGWRSSGWQG
jgi:hypothetical protein